MARTGYSRGALPFAHRLEPLLQVLGAHEPKYVATPQRTRAAAVDLSIAERFIEATGHWRPKMSGMVPLYLIPTMF